MDDLISRLSRIIERVLKATERAEEITTEDLHPEDVLGGKEGQTDGAQRTTGRSVTPEQPGPW